MSGIAEVQDFTIDGECSECGSCCSNLLVMSEADIRKIKDYVRKHKIKPAQHGMPLDAMVDMTCPFMEIKKTHKCKIYHVRPQICRFFRCDKRPTMEEARQMMDWKVVNVRKTFFGGAR